MITFLNRAEFYISFDINDIENVRKKLDAARIENSLEILDLKDGVGIEYAKDMDIDPGYKNEYTILVKRRDYDKAWDII